MRYELDEKLEYKNERQRNERSMSAVARALANLYHLDGVDEVIFDYHEII